MGKRIVEFISAICLSFRDRLLSSQVWAKTEPWDWTNIIVNQLVKQLCAHIFINMCKSAYCSISLYFKFLENLMIVIL